MMHLVETSSKVDSFQLRELPPTCLGTSESTFHAVQHIEMLTTNRNGKWIMNNIKRVQQNDMCSSLLDNLPWMNEWLDGRKDGWLKPWMVGCYLIKIIFPMDKACAACKGNAELKAVASNQDAGTSKMQQLICY